MKKKIRSLSPLQKSILSLIPENGPISMSTIRAKLYPDDDLTNKVRVTVFRSVASLEARHLITRDRVTKRHVQVWRNQAFLRHLSASMAI
jgi:hypothetical protein